VLRPLLVDEPQRGAIDPLAGWEASEFAAIEPLLQQRRRQGRVRECHGDLHLGNVVQIDGRCTVFDCIEFNDDFRHIDVMSDVAFMAMDLQAHGCSGLAHRFVNGYLERSGDYAGARVLRYYVVYRALVRAKVAALRAAQPGAQTPDRLAGVRPFIDLAQRCAQPGRGALLITHGLPGSGKTRGTQELLQAVGAIRIRADVERKRLFGLDPMARSGSALNEGLYSASATAATHARLHELTRPLLDGGIPVVLDATFGQRWQRDQARQLAAQLQLPFLILDFELPLDTLRARVRSRAAGGGDASEADLRVLEAQSRSAEPLTDDERACVLACPAQDAADDLELQRRWQGVGQTLQQRLAIAGGHARRLR